MKYSVCIYFSLSDISGRVLERYKKCENTNKEHAKVNMTIADEIVDNPLLSKWYGTFTVGQHGVFSINRTKAKMLLGRKLAQLRKPSAYKRKVHVHVIIL